MIGWHTLRLLRLQFPAMIALALPLSLTPVQGNQPMVLPLDSGEWKGSHPPTRVVDEPTGLSCLEYSEYSPLEPGVFYLEFDDPGLDGFDALEFRWKVGAANAHASVMIEGYPEGFQRRYYLAKRPNSPMRWQKVYLSLRRDDDGVRAAVKDPLKKGRLRLKFRVALRDLEGDPNPHVLFRFADLRLVRYPVRISGDHAAAETFHQDGRVGQRYKLTVENRTDSAQKVHLTADGGQLEHFVLDSPKSPFELDAGESREVGVAISIDEKLARQLGPLYSEDADIFAWAEEFPDLKTAWFDSYFLHSVRGVVPPTEVKAPRFVAEAARHRALQRIKEVPGAKRFFDGLRRSADEWLDREVVLPVRYHGYGADYVCREHASRLEFRDPDTHWCLKGKHLIEGDEFINTASDYNRNKQMTHAALDLARVGWLTGDRAYSRKAAEILLAYAAVYGTLPFCEEASMGFRARIANSVLAESWWFDPVPWTLDLVRGSGVLTPGEDLQIVEGLVNPAIQGISGHRVGENQQAEINHAVGTGALVAGNWPLAAGVLDGELGMRNQWKRDFDSDGMTAERELPYHFAAVKPFSRLADALRGIGLDVYDLEFKRLFDAPVAYATAQSIARYSGFYEAAFAVWNDPLFDRLVAAHRARGWSWESLLSPSDPTVDSDSGIGNTTLPAGGYTTLRGETGDGGLLTAMVNFGSPAWRGGKALLDPELIWNDLALNQRITRIGYGYEGHRFSFTPSAGNSLLVDGKGGSMLRADQESVLDGPYPAARWNCPPSRPHFAGVRWARTIALCGNSILVLDQIASNAARRFELVNFFPSPLTQAQEADWEEVRDFAGASDGFEYFRNAKISRQPPSRWRYLAGSGKSNVPAEFSVLGDVDEMIHAEAQAGWHPRWVPALVRRKEGNAWWTVACFTAGGGGTVVERLEVFKDGVPQRAEEALAVALTNSVGRFVVLTVGTSDEYQVETDLMQGPLAVLHRPGDSRKKADLSRNSKHRPPE